jgi:hypothetical protein
MRSATAVRVGVGGVCVVAPGRVLGAVRAPDRDDRLVRRMVRALGLRLVLQAGLDLAWDRRTRGLDIALELTHAASMLAAAVIWPAHRHSASVSAALAAGVAALDVAETRSRPVTGRTASAGS